MNIYENSIARINENAKQSLTLQILEDKESLLRFDLENNLDDGTWRKNFRGRDILKHFIGEHGKGLSYDIFRNLIIALMSKSEHQPPGMQNVINQITGN